MNLVILLSQINLKPNNSMSSSIINIRLLQKNPLFKSIDDDSLQQIVVSSKLISLQENQVLFTQQQIANYFYLVVEGHIKLRRMSDNGHEKIFGIIGQNQTFSEGVMFMEKSHYPVDAIAIESSLLYQLDSQVYLDILYQSPALCFTLLGNLSTRLHGLLTEIDLLTLQNARYRVARYLSSLVKNNRINIELKLEKKTIAARLSITPETLSRILRELTEQQIINQCDHQIIILDYPRLKNYQHH